MPCASPLEREPFRLRSLTRRVLEKKLYRIFCFLDEDMDSYISKSAQHLCRDKLLDLARITKTPLGEHDIDILFLFLLLWLSYYMVVL